MTLYSLVLSRAKKMYTRHLYEETRMPYWVEHKRQFTYTFSLGSSFESAICKHIKWQRNTIGIQA